MPCDNRGMAATVVGGTAPKLVQVNAGKLFRIASNISDSRKDGTKFERVAELKDAAHSRTPKPKRAGIAGIKPCRAQRQPACSRRRVVLFP